MPKANRNIGQEILEGIRQLKRGEHGRLTKVPSVTKIREKTGLSQPRFAELLGVSVRTLQEWEQGRRAPSGAARTRNHVTRFRIHDKRLLQGGVLIVRQILLH